MWDSLWDNWDKAVDAVSKGHDTYLDIKEGNKSTGSQMAEQELQNAQGAKIGGFTVDTATINKIALFGSIASIIGVALWFIGRKK